MLKFRFVIFFIGLAAFTQACSSSQPQQTNNLAAAPETIEKRVVDPEGARQAFIAGNIALNEKDWDLAKHKYKESISKNPEAWETYMNAAIASIMDSQSDLALKYMENCFKSGGETQQIAYFNLGNIYQERGLYKAAIDAYRAGLAVGNPNDLDSLLNIAAAYIILSEWDDAEKTYNHLLELDPALPAAYHGLAMVAVGRQDMNSGLKFYNEVISRAPNFAPSYFNKAELLEEMQRPAEALKAYNKYLELAPNGPYSLRARNGAQRTSRRN